jgi:3-isopropylmalate/(R)-2-methylmalate dehydratase large subunit
MDLTAGTPMKEIKVDTCFLRLLHQQSNRRSARASAIIKGQKKAEGLRMLVVPGSAKVRLEAEAEGLDLVFKDFGAEWRFAGWSMCLGMNPDQLAPGERAASTSNRNFERSPRQRRPHPSGFTRWLLPPRDSRNPL